MNLEGQQLVVDGRVEGLARDDCPQVAPGANQCGHDRQLGPVHERHDAVAGTLRHLHERREADEHDQSGVPLLGVVDEAEAEEEDGLEEEREELSPEAAREAKLREEQVARDAAQGAGEEVHAPEGRGEGGGAARLQLEVGPEVRRELVVHGQLRAEARGVLEYHHDDAHVLEHLHIVPEARPIRLPRARHVETALRRRVPTEGLHGNRADHEEHGRHDHGHTPSGVLAHSGIDERVEEHHDHEDLRDTASQVPPTRGRGVRRAHDVRREHQGGPELVRHEGGPGGADEEADEDVVPRRRDDGGQGDPEGAVEHEPGLHVHGAEPLQ
mmetsp:Transcript_45889/g.142023  ORF Transcript_45889/g.142023 Transcript_45889/m.142023 type:complete len:327 (-) Transcript_45889:600-1580(-)